MVQQKTAALIFSSGVLLTLFYYNYYENIQVVRTKLSSLRLKEPFSLYNDSEDFLIDTIGCRIPNYGKQIKFVATKNFKQSCGQRAVFVKKIDYNQVIFEIDMASMKRYARGSNTYKCCYSFASRSKTNGKEDNSLSYTSCEPFKSGFQTALLQETITVTCYDSSKKKSKVIYKDAYMIIKKRISNTLKVKGKKQNWNVLLLGMDTMSRARISNTMPDMFKYFQKHGWLDFRGYQKVGYNTFPNVMSFLTGMNLTSIYKACKPNMYSCNDHIIWSEFSRAGYTTAYGEDYLQLPDTFFNYNGFKSTPTHHYMRPLFLTGEHIQGNLVCTGNLPSGKHILDYAYDFADTYKKDGFFGIFWINSYSHNIENLPSLFENDVLKLFEKSHASGITNNTIIVFLSDHGIRFGPTRKAMQSYYEERLPMFFVWMPHDFRKSNEEEFYNLQLNQNRLVTPYDLHLSLLKLSDMSEGPADTASAAWNFGTSLFEEVPSNRTCADAGVSKKWCSCHDMKFINSTTLDVDVQNSLKLAVSYIQNKSVQVKTIDCMKCMLLQLDSVLRIHSYKDGSKLYYVIAFRVAPGSMIYEAVVLKDNNELSIEGGIDILTGYNSKGRCVKKPNDRPYCVCKEVKCS